MDFYTIALILLPIFIIFILKNPPKTKLQLPPGPKPWPIIGNIHLLGSKPHHSVTNLSKLYGPLMTLKLGSITTIVISSPKLAKELFSKHDLSFSSRHVQDVSWAASHAESSVIFLPVCPKWRELRKIVAVHAFSKQRLDGSQGMRRKKVEEIVEFAKGCCEKGVPIDIGKATFTTSLNVLSNMIFSMDLCSYDDRSGSQEFRDLIWRVMGETAKPNVSDFFPWLAPFDLQGVRRRATEFLQKMFGVFEKIIEERWREQRGAKHYDVLDTLLELVKEGELSLHGVKHLLGDLLVAGIDTASSTVQWAMTELLRYPEKMMQAQNEISQVLVEHQLNSIQESDISKLPYIRAIVKETLRLHPPLPFLVPRKATTNVELYGYCVPKNAQVWINVWSMARDPSIWHNANSFEPERFLGIDIDVKGRDVELIPFGAGRRICPEMTLGLKMVHLMLATLLHSFNWKCVHPLNREDIDVEEKFGITLQKAQPLQVIPLPRRV